MHPRPPAVPLTPPRPAPARLAPGVRPRGGGGSSTSDRDRQQGPGAAVPSTVGASVWRARARRAWRFSLLAVGAVLLGVVTLAGVNAWSFNQAFDSRVVRLGDALPPGPALPPVRGSQSVPAQNLLLLGSDLPGRLSESVAAVDAAYLRSILVVHIPADRRSVQVVAVPHGLRVEVPGRGAGTLDAALDAAGLPLVVGAVEGLVGAPMDRVGVFQFQALGKITDAVGGVTVDNPHAFVASGPGSYSFSAGPQRLRGDRAVAYVLERDALPGGDAQRIGNQHRVLAALLERMTDSALLTNLRELTELGSTVAPHLALDDGLTASYLAGLGLELRRLPSDVRFLTLPVLPVADAASASGAGGAADAADGAGGDAAVTDPAGTDAPRGDAAGGETIGRERAGGGAAVGDTAAGDTAGGDTAGTDAAGGGASSRARAPEVAGGEPEYVIPAGVLAGIRHAFRSDTLGTLALPAVD